MSLTDTEVMDLLGLPASKADGCLNLGLDLGLMDWKFNSTIHDFDKELDMGANVIAEQTKNGSLMGVSDEDVTNINKFFQELEGNDGFQLTDEDKDLNTLLVNPSEVFLADLEDQQKEVDGTEADVESVTSPHSVESSVYEHPSDNSNQGEVQTQLDDTDLQSKVIGSIPLEALGLIGDSRFIQVNDGSGKKTFVIKSGQLRKGTVRIVKAAAAAHTAHKRSLGHDSNSSSSDEEKEKPTSQHSYPELKLTSEEKNLVEREGVKLPSHYPLTRLEERELRRIRRKIRNKRSAQDSRKRKKEYMDALEDRVKQYTEEKEALARRVTQLESQNASLLAQLRQLQAAVCGAAGRSAPASAAMLILLFSCALLMAPSMRQSGTIPNGGSGDSKTSTNSLLQAGKRALLSDVKSSSWLPGHDENEGKVCNAPAFSKPAGRGFVCIDDIDDLDDEMPWADPDVERYEEVVSSDPDWDPDPGSDPRLDPLVDHDYEPPGKFQILDQNGTLVMTTVMPRNVSAQAVE
ncbi:unnamed protein product [Darwinula stevensoni]|nr:unnamed protein product [Darwinula stevensoni]CAG0899217.1 unnamed protein product [Darwinula stevensoni]